MRQTLTRRQIGILFCAAPFAVSGCGTLSQIPTFVTDLNTIVGALNAVLPSLSAIAGISSTTVQKITGYVSQLQQIAAQVASASGTGVAGLVANFNGIFGQITSLIGVNVPGAWGTVIQAAISLLPSILSAAGLMVARVGSAPAPFTPDQARSVLAAIAATR